MRWCIERYYVRCGKQEHQIRCSDGSQRVPARPSAKDRRKVKAVRKVVGSGLCEHTVQERIRAF